MKPFQHVNFYEHQFGTKRYTVKEIANAYKERKEKEPNFKIVPLVHDEFMAVSKDVLNKFVDDQIVKTLKEMAKSMSGVFAQNYGLFPPIPPSNQLAAEVEVYYTPPKPHPSAEKLSEVANKLAKKYGLTTGVPDFKSAIPLGLWRFEVACHEAIHSLLIDPTTVLDSEDVGRRIRAMPGWLANEHELSTLRIEAIALGEYFGGSDIEWIYERANWRPSGAYPPNSYYVYHSGSSRVRPSVEKLHAPLSVAECAIAQRFHTLIQEFL